MPIAMDWRCCLNSFGDTFKTESELIGQAHCDQFSDVYQGTGHSPLDFKFETEIPVEVI